MPLSPNFVVAAKAESADDFNDLFLANYATLSRLLYRVVGDLSLAEELAAEAFLKLYRSPPASDQNVVGWLFRTGLNLALDHLRQRKRRAHYESLTPTATGLLNPEETLAKAEQETRVRKVLMTLKPQQASLLILRSEGYNLAEMSPLLSLAPCSVGTLITRANSAFRKEYIKRYGEQ